MSVSLVFCTNLTKYRSVISICLQIPSSQHVFKSHRRRTDLNYSSDNAYVCTSVILLRCIFRTNTGLGSLVIFGPNFHGKKRWKTTNSTHIISYRQIINNSIIFSNKAYIITLNMDYVCETQSLTVQIMYNTLLFLMYILSVYMACERTLDFSGCVQLAQLVVHLEYSGMQTPFARQYHYFLWCVLYFSVHKVDFSGRVKKFSPVNVCFWSVC